MLQRVEKYIQHSLPSDVGCVVSNIDTVISVYMAVCESTPLIRRIVTVTGDAIKNLVILMLKLERIIESW